MMPQLNSYQEGMTHEEAAKQLVGDSYASHTANDDKLDTSLASYDRPRVVEPDGSFVAPPLTRFSSGLRRELDAKLATVQAIAEDKAARVREEMDTKMSQVRQELGAEGLAPISFSIPPERRLALLNGWDETDQIVNQYSGEIEAFEVRQRQSQPWLYTREFAA